MSNVITENVQCNNKNLPPPPPPPPPLLYNKFVFTAKPIVVILRFLLLLLLLLLLLNVCATSREILSRLSINKNVRRIQLLRRRTVSQKFRSFNTGLCGKSKGG